MTARTALSVGTLAAVLTVSAASRAVIAPGASAGAEPVDAPTCSETFPAGGDRPQTTESFAARGKSGHAQYLEITLLHRKGETVLPSGTGTRGEGDAVKALERAQFFLPDPKGGVLPTVDTKVEGDRARTVVKIPVVPLPKKPGRNELTLPPLPIAMARASGEVKTLCTQPHAVVVEDPTSNTPDAKPRGNPSALRQIEEWTAAKNAAIGAAIALVAAALVALLVRAWRRRPRPVPPPPPPRPPWEVALEELFDVRIAQLVEQGRFAEHFDRVSDAVRRYLGARYGFDGLETTTVEALVALRKATPRVVIYPEIEAFLHKADLVKFAKLTPEEVECHEALARAEDIVRKTMPSSEPRPRNDAEAPPGSTPAVTSSSMKPPVPGASEPGSPGSSDESGGSP